MIDQYFTPKAVASDLLRDTGFRGYNCVVDPTCGSGNLLSAVAELSRNVRCIGIDSDKGVIDELKKTRPNWVLSSADLMDSDSVSKTTAFDVAVGCELLLLNPPYSQNNKKFTTFEYYGMPLKCSVAMSFLLQALMTFSPKLGALIIVPESMMYSELDEHARFLVSREYKIECLSELCESTFKGARVRTVAIKLTRVDANAVKDIFSAKSNAKRFNATVIRGGAQMHKIEKKSSKGAKVIHTVDLVRRYKNIDSFSGYFESKLSGRIKGKAILIPRVGMPNIEKLSITDLKTEVQLSDCVLAMTSHSSEDLEQLYLLIKRNHIEFKSLYRGTGARYLTKGRLEQWLIENGACISS